MDTAKRSGAVRDVTHHLDKPGSGAIDRHGPPVDFWGLPDFSARYVAGVRPDYRHDHHNDRSCPMTKPTVNTETHAEFLERQPEPLRKFYSAIVAELPTGYKATTAGFEKKLGGGQKMTPFCTLFRVKALVRTPKSQLWSRVVDSLT